MSLTGSGLTTGNQSGTGSGNQWGTSGNQWEPVALQCSLAALLGVWAALVAPSEHRPWHLRALRPCPSHGHLNHGHRTEQELTTVTTTIPITSPITSPTSAAPQQCEAKFECENGHLTPCANPAVTRATFLCSEPGCHKAAHVKMLCSPCAARADRTTPAR